MAKRSRAASLNTAATKRTRSSEPSPQRPSQRASSPRQALATASQAAKPIHMFESQLLESQPEEAIVAPTEGALLSYAEDFEGIDWTRLRAVIEHAGGAGLFDVTKATSSAATRLGLPKRGHNLTKDGLKLGTVTPVDKALGKSYSSVQLIFIKAGGGFCCGERSSQLLHARNNQSQLTTRVTAWHTTSENGAEIIGAEAFSASPTQYDYPVWC
ncbi:hypothetical protein GQ44DRAFT_779755 [Phaeosphaeriaceae sp. PMI808]|nr:hypothetical protein GQ44DRAFT_779755 [Phaeosphaeriaceae sp. PMI808]